MRKKKGVCGICFLELDVDIIACQSCSTKFHEDHLAAWLRLKNNQCPHCRNEFDEDFIELLTPQTREQKEYLDSLEYLFGDMGRLNKINSLIEKRRTRIRSNKIAYVNLLLILLISLPMSFIFLESIFESSGIYILLFSSSVVLSIYGILIGLIIKIRKTIPELEELLKIDRQKLLDL